MRKLRIFYYYLAMRVLDPIEGAVRRLARYIKGD